ncbi:MAG: cell envelope integrity protein TolA [Hyphomicrobiaceae bacterium]
MRIGVIVSIGVHLVLLAWALYSVAATHTLAPVEDVPVNVDLVSIADVPNIRQGDKNAKTEAVKGDKDKTKQTEKPAKAKNERVAVVAPTKKEAVKAKDPEKKEEVKVEEPKKVEPKKVEPPPEPTKPEVKKEEPKVETATVPAKKAEEPKKKDEPKAAKKEEPKKDKKAVKAKEEFDPDKIAALLDKQPNAAAEASTTKAAAKPKEKPKLQIGAENGTGTGLTISEKQALIAALRQQIKRCWNPPTGATGADLMTVRLNIELSEDGMLRGMPRTLDRQASPLFLIAEESAVRAVFDCQPYNLPTEHYTTWRSVNFKFDPSEMLGSGFGG